MAVRKPLELFTEARTASRSPRHPSRPSPRQPGTIVSEGFGTGPPQLSAHSPPQHLLALQRLAGNSAVAELVAHQQATVGMARPPTVLQRAAGDPIVVQLTVADTVKPMAAAIGVAATVGAIAAYFFIPTALAYAVLAAAGGLGTAIVVDRLQARAGQGPGATAGGGSAPPKPVPKKSLSGPPKSGGKGKKAGPKAVPKVASAGQQLAELEGDPDRLIERRMEASAKYDKLVQRKAAIREKRRSISQVGNVPVDGDPTNRYPWINAPNSQAYDNLQGYLPGGAYTEYYRDITGGAQHHRMIRDDRSNRRWFTYGGTHPVVPGAWWAYWDGHRWWRWVGPTDAGGAGLGVRTEYVGYPVADIPNGEKLTELDVLLLEFDMTFLGFKAIDVDPDLIA
jgi:hypothetical protein